MGNPRDEVISQISMWSVGGPHLGPDDAGDIYDSVIDALHAAGFRILGPDEADPVTVEKCAAEVKHLRQLLHSQTITLDVGAEDMAYFLAEDAIRAIGRKI